MMINSSLNDLRLILIFVVFISIPSIELLLSGIWNRMYFTIGLPFFVLRISVDPHHNNIPSQSQLDAPFRASWVQSLVFRQYDAHKFAFREKIFQLRFFTYIPIMHGYLFFDHNNSQVVVKGFANWYIVMFFFIGIVASIHYLEPLIIFVSLFSLSLFFGILYWIQFYRYTKVAAFAAQAWSRQYPLETNTGSANFSEPNH